MDGHPGGRSAPKQKHLLSYGNTSAIGNCHSLRIIAIHPQKRGTIIQQIIINDG